MKLGETMPMKQRLSAAKWGILLLTLVSAFTVILNNSLLNVALPYFMEYYGLSAVKAQWIITVFSLGMLLTMTTTTYVSKKYGYKLVYAFGLSIFLLSSILGALSINFEMIIFARIFQGLGGGLLMPLSMILIFKHFNKRERGFATGIWGISAMVAPAIGPTVGGAILTFSSWQMLFLLNVPMTVLCLFITFYSIRTKAEREKEVERFDWVGFILLSSGLIILLLAIEQLLYPAHKLAPYMLFLLAGLCIWRFIAHSFKRDIPILNVKIFKNRIFSMCLAVIACSTMAMFAVVLIVPLLIQEVMGESPLLAGLIVLPHAIFVGLSMTIGGRLLDKRGPIIPLFTGISLLISVSFILSFTLSNLPLWVFLICLVFFGMGNGLINTPTVTTALNSLKDKNVSEGSSIISSFRQIIKVTSIVVISFIFEFRRGVYMLNSSDQYTSGLLAIKDCFTAVCIVFVLVIPCIMYISKKYRL